MSESAELSTAAGGTDCAGELVHTLPSSAALGGGGSAGSFPEGSHRPEEGEPYPLTSRAHF